MYSNNPEIIIVSAKASVETTITHASFRANVTTRDETGPAAKAKAVPVIESIKRVLLEHAESAGIDTESLKTTFAVDLHHDSHSSTYKGYKATYTVLFKATNVAEATRVHDALTSIPGVESPTPVFHLDKGMNVHGKAFGIAWRGVMARFDVETNLLGFDSEDYQVLSWEVTEDDRRAMGGKFVSLGASTDEGVSIEPGKATYDITLQVAFKREN